MRDVVAEDGTISRSDWIEQPSLWKAAYAEFPDDINWEQPDLGIEEYNGSTATLSCRSGLEKN